MATAQDQTKPWSSWTVEIKVWKILAVLVILSILQWRMGRTAALMGPFREPWEFG